MRQRIARRLRRPWLEWRRREGRWRRRCEGRWRRRCEGRWRRRCEGRWRRRRKRRRRERRRARRRGCQRRCRRLRGWGSCWCSRGLHRHICLRLGSTGRSSRFCGRLGAGTAEQAGELILEGFEIGCGFVHCLLGGCFGGKRRPAGRARIAAARTLSEAQCFQGFLGMYLGHEVGVHPVAETTPV